MIIADDFGESLEVNESIVRLSEKISLYGISCFSSPHPNISDVTLKADIKKILSNQPSLKIGLHFKLELIFKSIEKQLQNQERIFLKVYGREPDYIDSHMHIHSLMPLNFFMRRAFKRRLPIKTRSTRLNRNIPKTSMQSSMKRFFFKVLRYSSSEESHNLNETIFNLYSLSNKRDFELLWRHYQNLSVFNKSKTLFIVHPSLNKESWKSGEFNILMRGQY